MHWCTECGQPCWCDCDDMDYGDFPLAGLENCDHECEDLDIDYLYYDEEE